MLLNQNITKIIVPTLQVLSYRYHEIISESLKTSFPHQFNDDYFDYVDSLTGLEKECAMENYENAKIDYQNFVNKEDYISKNKCENLINMFYHLQAMGLVKITTEPFIESENLVVEISDSQEIANILARRN